MQACRRAGRRARKQAGGQAGRQAGRQHRWRHQAHTFARDSRPMAPSSLTSPSASTRTPSAHLAASTREIFPLNLGAAWPMSEAW
jgi:hypothetical protein